MLFRSNFDSSVFINLSRIFLFQIKLFKLVSLFLHVIMESHKMMRYVVVK